MKFTIFGSSGFIGTSLIQKLRSENIEFLAPDIRKDKITDQNLGHVIYAIGNAGINFKQYPEKTIDANVILLNKLLKEANFESFLYLSSTRVYTNAKSTHEDSALIVNPSNHDNLYNISKIMGEAICNFSKKQNVRIARLSNVTGVNFNSEIFLPSIIQDAIKTKRIILQTKLNSEKDYVDIENVLDILLKISQYGKKTIYNVASGKNLTNEKIVKKIQEITKCELTITKDARTNSFLPISIKRIEEEFNFKPTSVLNKFKDIIDKYKKY